MYFNDGMMITRILVHLEQAWNFQVRLDLSLKRVFHRKHFHANPVPRPQFSRSELLDDAVIAAL
jgi:hypothetical protein